jgi:hypothetical protein
LFSVVLTQHGNLVPWLATEAAEVHVRINIIDKVMIGWCPRYTLLSQEIVWPQQVVNAL